MVDVFWDPVYIMFRSEDIRH